MPKANEKSPETRSPLDLIRAFERCGNYPKDPEGVLSLCETLGNVSERSGIEMSDIVNYCVQSSEWCPTDHELIVVAQELRDVARRDAGSQPPWKRRRMCAKCGGTGWQSQQSPDGYDRTARCPNGCAVPEYI